MPAATRSFEVIELLTARGVDFIVVGMTAGVLQGAPAVNTWWSSTSRGMKVRVLGLARLIEVKRRAGRAKDLAVLPLLEATLARSRGDA